MRILVIGATGGTGRELVRQGLERGCIRAQTGAAPDRGPGVLTDGPKRGKVRAGEEVGHWLRSVRVSRADVAAFMLDQLTDDTFLRRAPGVAGA